MKKNAFSFLRDVGMFRDRFQEQILEKDVLPWLLDETCSNVAQMDSHNDYPKTLIGNYMAEAQDTHSKAVKAYAERIQAKRDAEKQAEEDKIKARQ